MAGRVIQGFFVGRSRLAPAADAARSPVHPLAAAPLKAPGPPAQAFAHGGALQQLRARGAGRAVHTPAATVAQPFGGDGSFAIDPAQVGLSGTGGKPLPATLLAKMEAAFATDFSDVRVHIGPQASRIGALAFTTGNSLYFAPGQFQPDTIKGQQLIGHELAHVIQQRQGRVRAPGNGLTIVQNFTLEAEADRLGMRAAAHIQLSRSGSTQNQRAAAFQGIVHRPGVRAAVQRAQAAQVNTNATLSINGALFTGVSSQGKGHAEMQALDEFIQTVRLETEFVPKWEDFENAVTAAGVQILNAANAKTVSCPLVPVCVACTTILQALGFQVAGDGTAFSAAPSGGVAWGVSGTVKSFLERAGHGVALKNALTLGAK